MKSESLEGEEDEEWQLKQSFNVRDHSGAIRQQTALISSTCWTCSSFVFIAMPYSCSFMLAIVRCVTAGSKFSISGGSDDSCKIYDMLERRELGTLQHHDVRCKINFEG